MSDGMKKALSITKTVLVWLLVVCSVAMMIFTVVSVNVFNNNNRSIFGYKAYIVLSDSMSTTKGNAEEGYFNAGDLILVREVDASEIEAGDIISYISTNSENYGETVTHMVRRKTYDANGTLGFVTYGTHTDKDDANVVTVPYVLGKYAGKLPALGRFFSFLKSVPGYIICILLPFLLLIGIQGFNSIRLFKRYKAEQLAELDAKRQEERDAMEAERKALAEERARQEELMKKLLEMQAQMQSGESPDTKAEGEGHSAD